MGVASAKLHDLRRTAVRLMIEAGFAPDEIATRVGHKDVGQLVMEVYNGTRQAAVRRRIAAVGDDFADAEALPGNTRATAEAL